MKKTVAIVFILFNLISIAQKITIEGTWIMKGTEPDNFTLHDTITFKSDGEFLTTTVKGTSNNGYWKKSLFKRKHFKLKACLHSADNIFKCRKFKWYWEIIEFTGNTMIVIQRSGWGEIKLTYIKINNIK